MKKMFYLALLGLLIFEISNVYFIMPMPGSQELDSLQLAYLLYTSRWAIRGVFVLIALLGLKNTFSGRRRWIPITTSLLIFGIISFINVKMSADAMFLKVNNLDFDDQFSTKLDSSRLVIGVEIHGEAKAYPIEFLAYHHQIQDTIAGKPIMVTYCSVCRSGRVYSPMVNNQVETFRLVGMTHFNAMFEDSRTHSWWQQESGEAVAGPLKGASLAPIQSTQVSLQQWFAIHPNGKVMSPDPDYVDVYDEHGRFEKGESKGALTRTDTSSWQRKSWVVGLTIGNHSKAYDWKDLKRLRAIHDVVGDMHILLAMASDMQSFVAFQIPKANTTSVKGDNVLIDGRTYDLAGRSTGNNMPALQMIPVYQEFWHSWLKFHPNTLRYKAQ
jgi:hypothetical protein